MERETSQPLLPPSRRLYCNRTLNLRSIKAIGYDMDYTLVHYRVESWERRAYERVRDKLAARGLPAADLRFDPGLVTRGLVVDTELGNLVKANRFGYVMRASHGTVFVDFDEQRRLYGRVLVDLTEGRWAFLNTLFSLSEACLYAQLVDRLDARGSTSPFGYADLYRVVRSAIDEAHLEGALKGEIAANPDAYVEPDPEVALALLDQREAGKRLLLITNSDWGYTSHMMRYAVEPFLPAGMRWSELFELVLLSARKPDFFSRRMPTFEVVREDGMLVESAGGIRKAGAFVGGDASQVQAFLGLSGDEILYVGDHIYADVHVSKDVLRWRTALILRELEQEVEALEAIAPVQAQLVRLMEQKTRLESGYAHARLSMQRLQAGYGPEAGARPPEAGAGAPEAGAGARTLRGTMARLRNRIEALDDRIAPLAKAVNEAFNPRWGMLMRAGNDKSHFARQLERYADVYTSRVSNFLYETPFAFLRAPRGSLPHDMDTRPVAPESGATGSGDQ